MAGLLTRKRRHNDQRPSPPVQMSITTPLAADALVLNAVRGTEGLSRCPGFEIDLTIRDSAVTLADLPGEPASLTLLDSAGASRCIHGRISRVLRTGDALSMTLHPWPWLLSFTRDSRIFQDLSVPDIVKQLAGEAGFGEVEDNTVRTYAKLDYCVQYRESSFDFISRLLEANGIAYAIAHADGSDKLTLIDDPAHFTDIGSISFRPGPEDESWGEEAAIHSAGLAEAVTTTGITVEDYNFETPGTAVTSDAAATGLRYYDYPAKATLTADAETIASDRLQMKDAGSQRLIGRSAVRALAAGVTFTLADHPQAALNRRWAVVEVVHEAEPGRYRNRFEAIPADKPYRPPLTTAKPVIAGIQTAKVVGPDGKEIWTDSHGRIRVKFHWDQTPAQDETCSCWMRVAQIWAGKGWGGFVLPRIGQEVVVSFLEGDPDRPLVTGCVYNGDNPLPYPDTADATKTVIRTNTSPHDQAEGKGYNELVFEDKAGAELIGFTAQKDLSYDVANARTVTIDKGDDTLTLNEGNRLSTIAKGNETHAVKGTRDLTIEGAETHTNKADLTYTISGNATFKVDGNITIEAGGSIALKAGTSLSLEAGTALSLKAGTELSGKAGTSLAMSGATMEIKGSGMGTVDGGGMLTVKGGLVKIN